MGKFIEAQFRRMQPDAVSVETVQYQLAVWQLHPPPTDKCTPVPPSKGWMTSR